MFAHVRFLTLTAACVSCADASFAQSPAELVQVEISAAVPSYYVRLPAGVTRANCPIPAFLSPDDLDYGTPKTRILLVGGLQGDKASIAAILAALKWFAEDEEAKPFRERFSLSAIPSGNPDGWALGTGKHNSKQGVPGRGYPPNDSPQSGAYGNAANPERYYLWRWIGIQAPDLVVEVRSGNADAASWRCAVERPHGLDKLCGRLKAATEGLAPDELAFQLGRQQPCNTGGIPALRLDLAAGDDGPSALKRLVRELSAAGDDRPLPVSLARKEIQARLRRTPLDTARLLEGFYGHDLSEAVYIPAMALVARLQMGELTKSAGQLADVEKIAALFVTGDKPSLPSLKTSGSHLSGHLIFGELHRATGKPAYLKLAQAAADLGFASDGSPREVMPYHNQMSDAVFMGCPILAQVGRLTGDTKYYDACLANMRYMLALNLRKDGLHRHSPLDETAWGRGNGFPALGLALSLSDIPDNYAGRDEMLKAFQAHMQALAPHQDASGCWHQVIDVPGSYRELSCTAMIGFALSRALRNGWLNKAEYDPRLKRAWQAVNARIGGDGGLVDVCTGTGKQENLRAYLDRPAVLGRDPRGGAMTLLFAVEMAR